MEQNKPILNALKMERMVTLITISLIQIIAALNILIALVMAVMEKYKDIAILMSMGARHQQIRNIFVLQGVLIGVVGSAIGLTLGYTLSYFADRYRWIRLDEQVYSLAYVPFNPRPVDAIVDCGDCDCGQFPCDTVPGAQCDHDRAGRSAAVRIAGMCGIAGYTHLNTAC